MRIGYYADNETLNRAREALVVFGSEDVYAGQPAQTACEALAVRAQAQSAVDTRLTASTRASGASGSQAAARACSDLSETNGGACAPGGWRSAGAVTLFALRSSG